MSQRPAEPSAAGPSGLISQAPSWSRDGYLLPNGHATLAVVTGVLAVVLGAPFGPFGAAIPLLLGGVCAACARAALVRVRATPWRGGRTGARVGLVCVGIVLAEVAASVV